MFHSNLYYFTSYFVSEKQNLIVKIFQIYSFGIQISFKNDSIGHVFLFLNYPLKPVFQHRERMQFLLSLSISGEPR